MYLCRLLLLGMLLWTPPLVAEENDTRYFYIKPSAFSGKIFMKMTEDDKALYLLGLGDGINLAPFLKADEETYDKYRSCFTGMTGADLANKVSDYLSAHPEQLEESIHLTAFKAYTEFCYQKNDL